MAAFSLQSGNLAWQAVNNYITATQQSSKGTNPVIQNALKDLKAYLSQQKRNPSLQFLPFTAAQVATAGGVVLATGTGTLYAFYARKTAVATQNTIKISDDATDDTTAANMIGAIDLRQVDAEELQVYLPGKALALGITVGADTTVLGTADGSAANAANGFVIVG